VRVELGCKDTFAIASVAASRQRAAHFNLLEKCGGLPTAATMKGSLSEVSSHAVVARGHFDFHRQFRNRLGTSPVFVIHARTATNQRPGQPAQTCGGNLPRQCYLERERIV
jgi:hypothetical protein